MQETFPVQYLENIGPAIRHFDWLILAFSTVLEFGEFGGTPTQINLTLTPRAWSLWKKGGLTIFIILSNCPFSTRPLNYIQYPLYPPVCVTIITLILILQWLIQAINQDQLCVKQECSASYTVHVSQLQYTCTMQYYLTLENKL